MAMQKCDAKDLLLANIHINKSLKLKVELANLKFYFFMKVKSFFVFATTALSRGSRAENFLSIFLKKTGGRILK